jgi:hypothetical protein
MQVLKVYLDDAERDALKNLARNERRDPRSQAALLIRDGLQRAGLLPIDNAPVVAPQSAGVQHDARP